MNAADHDAPITMLSVKDFFYQLSSKEQKYAHFMSLASHHGSRIVMRQVSNESEAIYDLIMLIHTHVDHYDTQYLDYVSQFLANLGNYKSFGDTKFIPLCSKTVWFQYLDTCGVLPSDNVPTENCQYKTYQELIQRGVYTTEGNMNAAEMLGFPSDGFVSGYYLGDNISLTDMKLLKEEFFNKLSILPENTRIVKDTKGKQFIVLIASVNQSNQITDQYPLDQTTPPLSNGYTVHCQFGDHHKELANVVKCLQRARDHVDNDIQYQMLTKYINHFQTGSSTQHKESQKLWVKDLSPMVETNIGFIETYREPSGIIGEFESLVSIQNKQRTAKFQKLVNNAESFISLLPWDANWEKPVFNPPDFTSLEVLTFTGSGIPAGINIPNYDDVRLTIGFKNVSLGNILSAATKSSKKFPPSFIQKHDRSIFEKYQGQSFEVQVGIH